MEESESIPPVFRRPRYQESKRQKQGQHKKDKDGKKQDQGQDQPRQSPPTLDRETSIDITA